MGDGGWGMGDGGWGMARGRGGARFVPPRPLGLPFGPPGWLAPGGVGIFPSATPPRAMHLDDLRTYCLAKPGATEDLPFGPDTLVFRVSGKMFALTGLDPLPPTVNLKCDPERAVELRERYADVAPGYHMSKRHWNTVGLQGDVPTDVVRELVDHSYALVVSGLPKAARAALGGGVA